MYTVYVLRSESDSNFYIGQTNDLDKRLLRHQSGLVKSTRHRRPFTLVFSKKFETRAAAMRFEKYLKSGAGHQYIYDRIGRHGP